MRIGYDYRENRAPFWPLFFVLFFCAPQSFCFSWRALSLERSFFTPVIGWAFFTPYIYIAIKTYRNVQSDAKRGVQQLGHFKHTKYHRYKSFGRLILPRALIALYFSFFVYFFIYFFLSYTSFCWASPCGSALLHYTLHRLQRVSHSLVITRGTILQWAHTTI